jgi:hypothetical protein
VTARLTRNRLIKAVAGAVAGLGLLPTAAAAARARVPTLSAVSVSGARRPYAGDRRLYATVSPAIAGRDRARLSFTLDGPARVRIEARRMGIDGAASTAWVHSDAFAQGESSVVWEPALGQAPGSYVMRLTVARSGRRRVYGGRRPSTPADAVAPVVHVLGVEAAFERRAYAAYEKMGLRIFADAPALRLTFVRCGAEPEGTGRNDEMSGVPFGETVTLDWTGKRSREARVEVQTADWPTGLYAARLDTADERKGFAPFVLRPAAGSGARQAVVLPTNTWQAYNLDDRDGDGWGDTWYAGGIPPVRLDRPYRDAGVPPRYRRYDLPFLQFLHREGLTPDYLCDDDLDVLTGDELRRRYDLIVFPGHSEYVTEPAMDAVTRFRDLGGRLVFLSANNFYWRVDRDGDAIVRVEQWRDLGRPEAALLGVQYRANDDGRLRRPFEIVGADLAPWLFAGTGLANGSLLGREIGGYGIEIDATTSASPPGTVVLARIRGLYGPGLDAEMSYYETEAGARVFSAGTLDFTGSSRTPPVARMLRNLWEHMLADLPPPPPATGG